MMLITYQGKIIKTNLKNVILYVKDGFSGTKTLNHCDTVCHLKARCIEDNPWPLSSFGKKNIG